MIALNSFPSDSDKSVLNFSSDSDKSVLNLFVKNRTHFNFVKLATACIVELTFKPLLEKFGDLYLTYIPDFLENKTEKYIYF